MPGLKIAINSHTSGKFTRETINGRSHIVTKMVPIVGDIAMNNIFYPEKQVSASYLQLDMMPAPAGHPIVNGQPVPAFHPLAINSHNMGGFVRSPRRDGKSVTCDFCLDEEVANNSDDGKETIRRIEAGESIGVSTGLTISNLVARNGKDSFGEKFAHEGQGFKFDHVAILLNENAAGAHAGTELITNSEGEPETIIFANLINNELSVRELRDQLDSLISAEVTGQEAFTWVREIFPDSRTLIYSVEIRGSSERLLKRSYSIDQADKATLLPDATPVVREVKFVPETPPNPQHPEVNDMDMDKEKVVLSLLANSAFAFTAQDKDRLMSMSEVDLVNAIASPITEAQAREFLTTNASFDFAAYDAFTANAADFAEFQKAKGERIEEVKASIIANSDLTAELLAGKGEAELVALNAAIVPAGKVDNLPPGATIHQNSSTSGAVAALDFT